MLGITYEARMQLHSHVTALHRFIPYELPFEVP